MLYRLVMTGRALIDMKPGALSGAFGELLCCCMDTTVGLELTGGLIWDRGFFLCVVEGEERSVEAFRHLADDDTRVADRWAISFTEITERRFNNWACGRANALPGEPAANDSFIESLAYDGPDAVLAHVEDVLRAGLVAESPPLALCS